MAQESRLTWTYTNNLYFIVTTLDHVAEQTLAKCEETFPIITKSPHEV